MITDAPLFETIYSLRAMRKLKTDPVPPELIERIIEAGTQAPSGMNTQPWAFLVVTDPAAKQFFGSRYDYWLRERFGAQLASMDLHSPMGRTTQAALHLAEHMHEAPVLLMACGKRDWPFAVPAAARVGKAPPSHGSIYPAVQNMLLAARGLGLGASLTTMHQMFEDELHAYFGIPENYGVVAVLPIGWPRGRFGAVRREPVSAKTHYEKWGARRS